MFGGVKVVLHHANLLHARGHRVTVVSKGPRPDWYPLRAPFVQVAAFTRASVPAADVTVATFWTTVEPALEADRGQAVHYCQGFEASFPHNVADHPRILSVYRLPIPAFVVAPHLAGLLAAHFGRTTRVVPPALERYWRPRLRLAPRAPFRVLVMHPQEMVLKGTSVALEAIRALRRQGVDCRLVRVTQWPVSEIEQGEVDRGDLHVGVTPASVARLTRRCDLLLAPSWPVEGFGLPVLEAIAAGLPVVASDIPAYRDLLGDWPALARHDDARAFADAAAHLLTNRAAWRRLRARGLAIARRFSAVRSARTLVDALHWAVGASWRQVLAPHGEAVGPEATRP